MNAQQRTLLPAILLAVFCSFTTATYGAGADFNDDGNLDVLDLDALVAVISSGTTDLLFDLTDDQMVDRNDLNEWLSIGGNTNIGATYLVADSNLDGTVDEQDFDAWNTNRFSQLDKWSGGDFNADGWIDGRDFLLWNNIKHTSSSESIVGVPEPSGLILALLGLFALSRRRT
jgi:hypothetical protein